MPITTEQADAVVEFASAVDRYSQMGTWSPWLSNSLLIGLNNNPRLPSAKAVREALQNYTNNEGQIQGYVEYANVFDMLFARTIKSYKNALAFDLQVVCSNAKMDDYQSEAYLKDKAIVYNFLDKFNYKAEFLNIVEQLLLRETYYTWFRKTKWNNKGMKYALQILPQDQCLLTGYWEKGLLFDFNMAYFLQPGVDINGYDPAFKKYYNRVFGEGAAFENYRPINPLNARDGTYAMWTQTSPIDGAWCFKFNTSNFSNVPFLAPLVKNALSNEEISVLQQNKDIMAAWGILAGEIATFDNAKSGTQTDQMVFKPSTLGAFMGKAKQGLSDSIKLAALPVKNLKFYQYEDKNQDMYATSLKNTAGVGSSISRVIYSSDRMSNAEIEAALNEVYQTMRPLYSQFSNFLEFYVNRMTKKFKFKFILDGSTYKYERQQRFDMMNKIADRGLVLPASSWASVLGYSPSDFENMLNESKGSGWIDKYSKLMLNTNTTKQSDNVGGRPREDGSTLSDSGEASREMLEE